MSEFPTYEFHVSRTVRDLYQFDQAFFSSTGNVVFANLAASREFGATPNTTLSAPFIPARSTPWA